MAVVRVLTRRRLRMKPSDYMTQVVAGLRDQGTHVETGVFAAHMQVELLNDGPVTFVLDSREGSSQAVEKACGLCDSDLYSSLFHEDR